MITKRRLVFTTTIALLCASVLFSSCIGSFNLSKKLHAWNNSIGDKWLNELIFMACWIVPVYELAIIMDTLVINSIEFWTGENPTADTKTKQVETQDGLYTITTDAAGHQIQKEGADDMVKFAFNKEENSWSLEAMGISTPLLQFVDNNHAKVFLADGSTLTVGIDEAGVLALRQVMENKAYFAAK
jgi:hypothetical protein